MKRLLIFVFLFICGFAKGQVYQLMPQYGYDVKRMKFDSTLQIPTFCGAPTLRSNILNKAAIAYDSCNKRFYYYDPKLAAWDTIKGGGGASIDTTSLSNRINQKVDSVKRISDSVYFYKNGIAYFAFKDSVQNGTFGDDTALIVLAKVHNSTGTLLTRGTVVMLNGATGDVASVIRANNKNDTTSARTIGIVKDNIAIGGTGYVVTQGQASGLNLGAYTAGDVLYLDSIDGGLTKTKPVAPYHNVFIGIVERANNGNGLLYVKPLNGFELDELHTVKITNPINNQILAYSDTQKLWKNRNIYSIVDTTSLSNRINNLTLDSVVKKGNASSLPIYVYGHLGITDASATGDGKINYDNEEYFFTNQSDEEILKFYKNTLILLDSAGNTATIKTLNNNANLTITLPDVSGQLLTYTTANAQYLNKADTSSMLTNYQRTSAFPIATFGAGSGASGDTTAFTTSAIYGSFYLNSGSDTIIVTGYTGVVQGTSASVTPTIWFNDSLNVTAGATKIVNSPSAVTSTTTGNTVTSLDNTKIPPGNFVWVTTGTVTTKPTYFSLTLIGYRKR